MTSSRIAPHRTVLPFRNRHQCSPHITPFLSLTRILLLYHHHMYCDSLPTLRLSFSLPPFLPPSLYIPLTHGAYVQYFSAGDRYAYEASRSLDALKKNLHASLSRSSPMIVEEVSRCDTGDRCILLSVVLEKQSTSSC
jgi:hypothetical protein